MCAKFSGNPISRLCFMAVSEKKKKEEKMKKMSDFLKAYISGMAGAIYFRSGMYSLPICQCLHSEFGLVWSRDHRTTNTCKSCFVLHVNMLTLCAHAPFSWAAQVCLDLK